MAASLAGHSDARHVHPPGNVATPADIQSGSLSIRDSLARGADPLELYHSIKVARAEAQANGRTIDVPEEDLRAILEQIDDLHDEVDALLTGTTEEKEEDSDSGDTSTDAKTDASQKLKASDESNSGPKPVPTSGTPAEATSSGDKVSGPKPYFDVDNFLDSVSFKQKTPVDSVEGDAAESLAETAQPSSSVSKLPTQSSTSKKSESTDTTQSLSATSKLATTDLESDNSALIATTSTSTTDDTPQTMTNAPALKAAITTSMASSASESSDEEFTTTTVTSTRTRTITLTEAHKNNGTSTTASEQIVTGEVMAIQTPSAAIVNLKAIDQVDSDRQTVASTSSTAKSEGTTTHTSASAVKTTAIEVSSESSASATSLGNVSQSSSAITQSSMSSASSKEATTPTVSVEPAIKAVVGSSRHADTESSSSRAVESSTSASEISTVSSIAATEEAAATPTVVATDTTSSDPKSDSSVEPTSTVAPSDLATSVPPPASSESVTESELVDPAVKVIVTSTANSNVTLTGFRTMVRV
ncbi:hypothetical protein CC79DRAFT_1372025 [Sarocladium strictum]